MIVKGEDGEEGKDNAAGIFMTQNPFQRPSHHSQLASHQFGEYETYECDTGEATVITCLRIQNTRNPSDTPSIH